MVRLSKQTRRRSVNFKRPKASGKTIAPTMAKNSFKPHQNAVQGDVAMNVFIPKID